MLRVVKYLLLGTMGKSSLLDVEGVVADCLRVLCFKSEQLSEFVEKCRSFTFGTVQSSALEVVVDVLCSEVTKGGH